ncbi:MAG: aldehyde ferredoxin oxidoreductase family protein [Deltaproteobacteria bacterium]|nr:aldehyde ferredoxin oxidoreductase family protein [Deltaproteobacteria bacterium]
MKPNDVPFAYAGKILRVNLSNGAVKFESTVPYAREWLGASGIAIKILYDELHTWVTPYDPANKLIFAAGALVGTTAPGANKSNLSTLGPVIGGWASGLSDSYAGGQLKCAGYDMVVIEGRAYKPVYLKIFDEIVEICDASALWGKTTWETLDMLRDQYDDPNLHALSIGPAGEHLVRGACVIQDKSRAFGRCGSGAVMGSKNLKAIVVKGTGGVKVADPKRFMKANTHARKLFKNSRTIEPMRKYGTLGGLANKIKNSNFCYKNFQELVVPDEMAKEMDPRQIIDKYQVSRQSYPGCAIGCSRNVRIEEGPWAGLETEASQMESLCGLQGKLGVAEPTFSFKAHSFCNEMGLDVDLAGGAIGWAMECFQRGIIDKKDTGGLALNWGDADLILELIRMISYREGIGNLLSEGSAKAADIIGRESSYYAMHIKGQDLYEPLRGSMGWALGTTTSTRGGGHTTGAVGDTREGVNIEKAKKIFGVDNPFTPLEYEGKAAMVFYMEIMHRVANCLGVCHFNTIHWDMEHMDLPHLAELYSAATGWETTVKDFQHMTLRQLNLEKAFNLRFTDFDRKDDLPTPRDMNEPIPSGSLKGWKMDMTRYNQMLDEYYDLHGWDRTTSYPKRETLLRLDLENVADDLDRIGKLPDDPAST